MGTNLLHLLELGDPHCPSLPAASYPGCSCATVTWARGLFLWSPVAGTFYQNWSRALSPTSSEHVALALSFPVHPKMQVYAEGLPSGAPFPEAPLWLPPYGWGRPPAPRFRPPAELTQWLPVPGCSIWPLPWVSPLVRPRVPAQRPAPVRPDLMVWPR